ncbi:hypothetical protein CONPUDRAFT_78523 [Coniophora puteana RWD-64-598 SS2]|uniref:Peptidase C14 caspase domain-containing protein n=1 Tax=Coniophora puteana (strain RWD-64-598) TaxID=741705 RepID=A0A5M3N3G4_CONPW|nr:uncharacterized protein CONPUDRAFT_78523 [Coniophora puteana RWD-64-598 SS2]EIW85876.1 hypothetical protein CONPUDRAFT_78523 [Coniophora puteana RWD-64-598 SS2]
MPASTSAPAPYPNSARPPSPYTPVQPLGYTYSHHERHNSSSTRPRRHSDVPPPPPPKHHPTSGSTRHQPQTSANGATGAVHHFSSTHRLRPPPSPVIPGITGSTSIHHTPSSQRLRPSTSTPAVAQLHPALHHPAGAGGVQRAKIRPQGVRFDVPETPVTSIRPTVNGRHPHRRATSQPVVAPNAPSGSTPNSARAEPPRSASTPSSKTVHPNGLHSVLPAHSPLHYSKCTGTKKALLIGINYIGQKRELKGCINDVRKIREFLIKHWGYQPNDIVLLMDDTTHPRRMPTKKNMLDGMKWLVKGARPHDSLFFHYSGHGGQVPDKDGDEIDGLDEVIYPVDYKTAGIIVDDEMHKIMVKSLPPQCRLTAIFDSCHSGTALDLPYVYHHDGRLRGNQVTPAWREYKSSSADVISFTGCRDDQTSADTNQGGDAVGAMSWAFRESLSKNKDQSYQSLLMSIRALLKDNYKQKPQLSSSHPIHTTLRFIM